MSRFADDYLSVGEYNVFSCDWGKLEDIYYPHAAAVTEPVGKYLAGLGEFLSYLCISQYFYFSD